MKTEDEGVRIPDNMEDLMKNVKKNRSISGFEVQDPSTYAKEIAAKRSKGLYDRKKEGGIIPPLDLNKPFDISSFKPKEDKGKRENKGKIRYDLFEPWAMKQLALVFTKGAEKYEDRNWEKGMKWSKMRASLGRHLAEYDAGKDFDIDPQCKECREGTCINHTGLYHIAQVAWNALGILSYYKLFPQGDDRRHDYLNRPKIGLDIDEVICDWVGAWTKKFGYEKPKCWNFMYKSKEHFESFSPEELHEFYVNIPAKIDPADIPFEPHCYITSRSVKVETTQEWILKHGFPAAPIYSIGFGQSKVEVAKESGIDIFVDDRYENFVELNNAGICTYLLDAPHNHRYNVGYKRIYSLKELLTV